MITTIAIVQHRQTRKLRLQAFVTIIVLKSFDFLCESIFAFRDSSGDFPLKHTIIQRLFYVTKNRK